MQTVPKIIHQIWGGGDEQLPNHLRVLSHTWKERHPAWKYMLWDDHKINIFVRENYPLYWDMFKKFTYPVQRWDTARCLILEKFGGVYLDFDTECLQPIDELLEGKPCWFSLEPVEHATVFKKNLLISTSLMGSVSGHHFIKKIVSNIFSYFQVMVFSTIHQKVFDVLKTTGPMMVTELYESLPLERKDDIALIPAEYLSPFTSNDTKLFLNNLDVEFLEKKLEKAYAIHYFLNDWVTDKK